MEEKTKKKKLKIGRIVIILLIIIAIAVFAAYKSKTTFKGQIIENDVVKVEGTEGEKANPIQEEEPEPDITISIAVIGDIMCHNTQYQDAYDSNTGTYDFSYVFEDIKDYISSADLAIGNLETTFAGSTVGYSSYPTFNTPEAMAQNLKDLGIDVLSTANNHSLDKGYFGLESTINYLDEAEILHTGTYTSEESQNTIVTMDVNGVKFAFLSFTYGTNGIAVPSGKEYCINLTSEELILKQLELAKAENPDVICVNMHWGEEYQTTPNSTQNELADFLFENGVDLILGSHPHVLQPMEKRTVTLEDGTTKDGFVIYSLGNFISGQVKENTRDSIILHLTLTKNGETGAITIDEYSYTPIYMYKSSSGTKAYKLIDINNTILKYESGDSDVSDSLYSTVTTELEKIKKILGE